MNLNQIYGQSGAPDMQAVSQAASADRNTTPMPSTANHAVAVSWIGVLIALILLRLVYEVSE